MSDNQFSRTMSECTRRLMLGMRGACRRLVAPSNFGWVLVLALCLITIASFALGFAVRPSNSTPAKIPNPPVLNISFQSGKPLRLFVYSFLKQAGDRQTELVIDATGSFAPNQTTTHWTVSVLGFTGHICPNQATAIRLTPVPGLPRNYVINGHSKVPAINGEPFLVFKLCWNNGSPLITSGSYISAALSPILAAGGQIGTVTRSLVLSGTSLSSYSLAGGIAPTEATARSWVWTDNLSGRFESQARAEIPIIASSLPGIQRDQRNTFYSGILFGIAGGALVSLVQSLHSALDQRNAEDKQRAADAAPHARDPSRSSAADQTGTLTKPPLHRTPRKPQ